MFGIKSTKDLVAQIPEQTTTIAEKQDTLNTVKQIKRSGGTKEQKQYANGWNVSSQQSPNLTPALSQRRGSKIGTRDLG